MTERLRLPLLLATLLVCAQLLLAWHNPSHIDTDLSHAQSVQECHLGGQAHAPALPGHCPELISSHQIQLLHDAIVKQVPRSRTITVLARGPPTC